MIPAVKPVVTVIMVTYNHERYIRQAVESVLAQEAPFAYELVIVEDCSTDATRDIVCELARAHPERIRLRLSEKNQGYQHTFLKAIEEAPSPYVALLDGDDYWTSAHKLRRQVEYLDARPDCSLCFHNVDILFEGENRIEDGNPPDQKEHSTLADILDHDFINTCSTVIRKEAFGTLPSWYAAENCPDWWLFVMAAQRGRLAYLPEKMAVYRVHSGGVWSGKDRVAQLEMVAGFYRRMLEYLPPAHAGLVRTPLGRTCYELARECERRGDPGAAKRWDAEALAAQPDRREFEWRLRAAGGSSATLEFPVGNPEAVRLRIAAAAPVRYDLQLSLPHRQIRAGSRYRVRFHATADRARTLGIGLAAGHEPWNNLGFYQEITLAAGTPAAFDFPFTATVDEPEAHLHIDAGGSDVSFELSSVRLDGVASDAGGNELVSIVVPFRNGERYLREAVDSVLAQTHTAWELLLVDDGSTDGGTAIAKRYAERHPNRIFYLEHAGHENRGTAASRNLAIRRARGGYVAFLDCDDVWRPEKLRRQLEILQAEPRAGMVYGLSRYWYSWTGNAEDASRDYIPELGIAPNRLYEPPELVTLLYPLGQSTPPPPSDILMRRDAIDRAGGFEERFHGTYGMYEDQAFLVKVYLTSPVFVSDEVWDQYRVRPDSCMNTARRAGDYREIRNVFLNWFRDYLHEHEVSDPAILAAVESARNTDRSLDEEVRISGWTLRTAGGSMARLLFPPGASPTARVEISRIATATPYDVQLNHPRIEVSAGAPYRLTLRVRSDAPRPVGIGLAQGHDPWQNLGFYRNLEVLPEWQIFESDFTAAASERNARIHFDLGTHEAAIEIGEVNLLDVASGTPVLPKPAAESPGPRVDALAPPPPIGSVDFGSLRRVTPISRNWGLDRGLPVDRYYIRKFLRQRAASIRGRVLEIGDDSYTREFGGDRVSRSDVLHIVDQPQATIVGDLVNAPHIPGDTFDCIILTQTLQLIYDVRSAIATLHRILKPGGVLLTTFPGISQTYDEDWSGTWCWSFTRLSAQRLFAEHFARVDLATFGNVLAAVSFLHGISAEELTTEELDYHEPGHTVTIGVEAVKGGT